jgi:glycosyltransferase involved in cell wall biosynthesis
VDVQRFRPGDRAAERAALDLPADDLLLLCVGHLIERKGQHLLLEALARLAVPAGGGAPRVLLVGSGPGEPALRSQAARLGLTRQVSFVGAVPPEALPSWYRAADALVLPSLREGWPNVVLEALACGTPVVARPCGAVPEIVVDGETGWLGDTVRELADAVRRVDRIDRARCRAAVIDRFSVGTMTDGYERVYRELL